MKRVLRSLESAKEARHRRMVVITGEGSEVAEIGRSLLDKASEILPLKSILYMAEFPRDEKDDEERFSRFKDLKPERVPYAKGKEVLGRTYDALILDAFHNFPAKDVGIAVETVRGPGLIILFAPPLEEWIDRKLFFHGQYVVTPPYSVEDCGNLYQRRVVQKLREHPGIFIIENGKVVSGKDAKVKRKEKRIKIPSSAFVPEEIYRMARTQDQADVIHALEGVIRKRTAYVLLADRGRGKSAALGLFLAGLSHTSSKSKLRIVVTGPSFKSVEEVFHFLKRGLDALGTKYSSSGRKVKVGKVSITYHDPLETTKEKGDILVADEAASIYVSLLREYLSNFNSFIFSTTSHGYEGTGRLFQYRFLPTLQERLNTTVLRMSEPIRYGEGDPIEKWLYDVFLLDAEPAEIKKTDREDVQRKRLVFNHEYKEKLFLEDEKTLREYIGIYVFAHYRNNPRDIVILADAPNQRAFTVKTSRGKVVGSLQVAEEGGLDEKSIYRMLEGDVVFGNIIPDIFLKYYAFEDFARMRGLRVVRIATHPELQGMGIGSFGLKNLEEYAKERGYGWVGAGFGASVKVLRFWKKNGYILVHISPKRNVDSGEYSTIFVKPLNSKAEKYINIANFSAKSRLVEEMGNYYSFMDPAVALELLESGPPRRIPPNLSEGEWRRLMRYVEGSLFYDAASDVVGKVVRWYFLSGMEPELPQMDRMYLIEKVLKKKTWKEAAAVFGMDPVKFGKRVDKILYKIWKHVEGLL